MKPLSTFVMMILSGLCAAATHGQESEWISLFDGKSLDGWRANEHPEAWSVQDGAIVTGGERSHLFYAGKVADHNFKNFEFSAEVMTTPGSNSGIYIHTQYQDSGWPTTGYELQVINSSPVNSDPNAYVERKMTGSLYAVRNNWRPVVGDNEWFEYRILVSGKTIRTFINGKLICDYTEAAEPPRPGERGGRVLSSGTLGLQAHDPKSVVRYRNLRVRLLPQDAPSLGEPLADRELDTLITEFSGGNFALIDLGLSATNPLDEDRLAAELRQYGMNAGYQFNRGEGVRIRQSLWVFNDSQQPVKAQQLAVAKQQGAKVAFSSGGAGQIDPEHLKQRLQALRDSKLEWRDLWVPPSN